MEVMELKDESTKERNILTDIQYLEKQVEYLENYSLKINTQLKNIKNRGNKWNGPANDEALYVEVERWLKCYNQFRDHIYGKPNYLKAASEYAKKLSVIDFTKPKTYAEEVKSWKAFKRFAYSFLPFLRINHNKKKIKEIAKQVQFFADMVKTSKKVLLKLQQEFLNE